MAHGSSSGGVVMQVKIETYGVKELKRAFEIMSKDAGDAVLTSGVNAAAKVVRDAAIAAAPRGDNANRSVKSIYYGRLYTNIRSKTLKKRRPDSRAAIVTRGRAFWGDLLNRGTRYIPASRWYDKAFAASQSRATQAMIQAMSKRIKTLSNAAIRKAGAGKK